MNKHTYPRFDSYRKLSPATTSVCKANGCGKQATRKVFIQINYMRGDDQCVLCCDEHGKIASSRPEEFVAQFKPEEWK